MIIKGKENREQVEIFSIEEFVPKDHLLRKIDSAVDFTQIYDIVEDLYSADNSRLSIDPVVIFKMVLIQHFSTISYNFKHRYTEKTIEEIFYWILGEINKAGYLSPEAVFIDGTHIKANANLKKAVKNAVPQAAKIYEKQLLEEVNKDREKHDKNPLD